MPFNIGDRVTVTKPEQPTGHKGGEIGTVIDVSAGGELVRIEDAKGRACTVWATELTRNA